MAMATRRSTRKKHFEKMLNHRFHKLVNCIQCSFVNHILSERSNEWYSWVHANCLNHSVLIAQHLSLDPTPIPITLNYLKSCFGGYSVTSSNEEQKNVDIQDLMNSIRYFDQYDESKGCIRKIMIGYPTSNFSNLYEEASLFVINEFRIILFHDDDDGITI